MKEDPQNAKWFYRVMRDHGYVEQKSDGEWFFLQMKIFGARQKI
jgi:hypothetical protein